MASVVDAVCSDFKVQHMYAEQHKGALAASCGSGAHAAASCVMRSKSVDRNLIEVGQCLSSQSSHWDLKDGKGT